ncbi:MAG: hypothetical protein WCL60_13740 [Methylococcales bacterium]
MDNCNEIYIQDAILVLATLTGLRLVFVFALVFTLSTYSHRTVIGNNAKPDIAKLSNPN